MTEEKTKEHKRHIITDKLGNLLCVYVHVANIHNTKGDVFTFEKVLYHYLTIIATHADQRYRGTFKNTFEVQPLCWKVERTLSWFQSHVAFQKTMRLKLFTLLHRVLILCGQVLILII